MLLYLIDDDVIVDRRSQWGTDVNRRRTKRCVPDSDVSAYPPNQFVTGISVTFT